MNIIIKESKIQFKNPQIGQPTRAIKEHYNGRRIVADIDGEERMLRFKKDEMPFVADEDDMILAIEQRLVVEQ
ncbi:hypothetical protein SAMN02745784_02912 [Tissierella praeacuta DSM 18095]|uniref:Uncharacterized protein n=1 Tax=Tissierella praeacuta DSM 18095 TaxID=1123404 RepID=A0A1M4Z689_9FIRM|nr:hypothetical protein [Tissierella praeacuta]SHF13317.1 hypothetical protein SAMN02745784_02912 [Tissierella praeacuta DSM 18095]SUP00613.1 Uncharacterised protein [Tissierella praeacuta]